MAKRSTAFKASAVVAGWASGLFVALVLTAPWAAADPLDPNAPLPPAHLEQSAATDVVPVPAPVAPAAADVVSVAAPAEQPAAADVVPVPPNGVPHLASPDALPPGSTMDPTAKGPDGPNVSYLKDLFHAVQDQQISGREALLMGLAQRGMNTPYPQHTFGPNVPTSPAEIDPPAAPAPEIPAFPPPAGPDSPAP